MSERLERITNRQTFDAVHADQLWMAPYANDCQGVGLKVLDQHNAVFKVPERLAENQRNPILQTLLRREASKLASFEEATIDRFDRVVWVSEDDRASFPAAGNGAALRHPVIPIAVDPSARLPLARPRPFRVTFLGGLHWPPNGEGVKWFAERVWPRVSAAVPGCVFTVIGKGGNGLLDTNPKSRIEVTGYVSAVEPYLSETSAFVVPLLTGAGMRVKILDAWSWGLPVVSTSIGAEGIKVADGQNLLLADDEEAFADSLVRVLQDSRLAASLSANGRATVESLYDWRTVYRAWDQVYS
jgi:glycosyltransferase involved in cell wall biosynthesis